MTSLFISVGPLISALLGPYISYLVGPFQKDEKKKKIFFEVHSFRKHSKTSRGLSVFFFLISQSEDTFGVLG